MSNRWAAHRRNLKVLVIKLYMVETGVVLPIINKLFKINKVHKI